MWLGGLSGSIGYVPSVGVISVYGGLLGSGSGKSCGGLFGTTKELSVG